MRPIVRALLRDWLAGYDEPLGPVVEVGAYQVHAGDDDLRPIFGARRYVGVDRLAGPGVTVQAEGAALPLREGSAGVVVCADTLEHVREPAPLVRDCYRVLRPGGFLFLLTVFVFPIHHEPDFWRFTPEGLEALCLQAGATSIQAWQLGEHPLMPQTVAAVARKDADLPDVAWILPPDVQTFISANGAGLRA